MAVIQDSAATRSPNSGLEEVGRRLRPRSDYRYFGSECGLWTIFTFNVGDIDLVHCHKCGGVDPRPALWYHNSAPTHEE